MRRFSGLVCVLMLSACTDSNRKVVNNNRDFGLNYEIDMANPTGGGDDANMSVPPDLLMSLPDYYGIDGGSYVYDLAHTLGDGLGACPPGRSGMPCGSPIADNAGCIPVEVCNNGTDDNCNGQVDEGCACNAGDVESCFVGPPGKRNVGACTDGQQTCLQFGETTGWGPCQGTIGPSPEICDGLDNDCNGCVDDGLCCSSGGITCPAQGDPRIAPVAPFTTLTYNGGDFFPGTATSWSWTVSGGPCDQLFAANTNPVKQSFTVTNADQQNVSVSFTLSGDYTVTLTVVDDQGATHSCKWVQHVMGPGVRFELCWDHTGPGPTGSDLDLHVHRFEPSLTTQQQWFGMPKGRRTFIASNDDCFWFNCKVYVANSSRLLNQIGYNVNWGYATSGLSVCSGTPNGADWANLTPPGCRNPRLDIDNILDVGVPENVNIDNPNNGDQFRAMVHYYGQGSTVLGSPDYASTENCTPTASPPTAPLVQHPIVNIYCGGKLLASYGQAPNQVSGFDCGIGAAGGEMWRVADVTAQTDAGGNTVGCTIKAIHPAGLTTGYFVTPQTNTSLSY
jgi:hypothetical protein